MFLLPTLLCFALPLILPIKHFLNQSKAWISQWSFRDKLGCNVIP